ncbi:peptidoglycan L-alanyl-D-glutamate endopeptidase [Paenibacillus chitinolyticus]|uniref:M15 family metallopeptidase n=1 Tax=Paenibacillus chitinolyticus TaxID=79263 RepID=A0A410X0A7_9BACL|nr:M15 family metallopeptidase [Paenibacillus chitinolyticus]MCY9593708.1 M15 family metallopeptidase [Paenibacillus chitinolyticus]MCY9599726.1 M15 family metallopeptidase [Paenibacillus chitinolyticus]QAV20104.1 peptidoglycan L-alanyl-D-glutamate endopeptidase [Paenibacillus chitinolyticus]
MLTLDYVLKKSEFRLAGLHPNVAAASKRLIVNCYKRGVTIVITQGLRTFEEQDALYCQGRSKPGPKVTNAKAGESFHNFGVAIDFALLMPDGKNVSWDMTMDSDGDKISDWMEVVTEAKQLGFSWGGDWTGFKDYPHFEMTFGLTIKQYQAGKRPAVTLIQEEDMEVEVLVFEHDWMWKQLGDSLDGLYRKGVISDYTWAEKAYTRKLTKSELTWINIVISARNAGVNV